MNLNIAGLDWEHDVSDGWLPVSAVAIIKSLDEDGDLRLSVRSTKDMHMWDVVGLLHVALLNAEKQAAESWDEGVE